ncbi:MAG: hypothetical protein AB1401_10995 [Thermodesulfobacteriota bacterium]
MGHRFAASSFELIENGIFRDYIVEGGWHGTSAGDRCRYALVARALGKRLPLDNPIGFLFWRDGEWIEFQDYFKDWPKESHLERNKIAAERATLSRSEAFEYFHVSLKDYLSSMTDDKRVIDFYTTLARWQMCINDESKISAGDWIL